MERDSIGKRNKEMSASHETRTGDQKGPPPHISAALAPTILRCMLPSDIVGEPCLEDRYSRLLMGWEGPRGPYKTLLANEIDDGKEHHLPHQLGEDKPSPLLWTG